MLSGIREMAQWLKVLVLYKARVQFLKPTLTSPQSLVTQAPGNLTTSLPSEGTCMHIHTHRHTQSNYTGTCIQTYTLKTQIFKVYFIYLLKVYLYIY